MDNREISELIEEYGITGSQSDSLDGAFSPGSQNSILNIQLDELGFIGVVDSNKLDLNAHCKPLPEVKGVVLDVKFESQTLPVTKSAAWTFSEPLNRLYVNISQPCPIRLKLYSFVPPDAILRCLLRYQKSEYASDPVTQCANHSYSETNSSLRGHVLRCRKVGVRYEKDTALGRYSLCLPLDRNEAEDADGDTFVFEFKCLSTCLGRRAMELVFQVECSGSVVCCHSVNVRVCSCPGRDRKHDENPHLMKPKTKSERNTLHHSVPLKRHLDEDNEEFTIKVKGKKNYELLLTLKQKLEMADEYERQVAEANQDLELASPKAKTLMTTKEQLKDPAKRVLDHRSADVDRSHHRSRTLHLQQLQQSQNQLTGKFRKNSKAFADTDSCSVFRV